MMYNRSLLVLVLGIFVLALNVVGSRPWGQPKPPPPANPLAPGIAAMVPNGGQRGTAVEVNITGTNLLGPAGVWTGFPSKSSIPAEDKNGTDPAKVKVKIEVP